MTEDEAKTKWCPVVRAAYVAGDAHGIAAVNRNPDKTNNTTSVNCIASECMMWRWDEQQSSADGHCGLAK